MKRICSLSLLSIAAVSALSCSQERKEKPNVLFIAIDDLNDWVGAPECREQNDSIPVWLR